MTQYSGKIIRKNAVVPTQQSASGVWTVTDAAAATRNNAWPVAGVPDPISRSVRFRSSASAYFNRTQGTPTDEKKFTQSVWLKRGTLGVYQAVIGGRDNATGETPLYFTSGDQIGWGESDGVSTYYSATTTAVFRDPSAWYHIVTVYDSNNATAADRLIIYVNGVRQAITISGSGSSIPSGRAGYWNQSGTSILLGATNTATDFFDGYLTEVNSIDGQALTPSSFGTTDPETGAWEPMAYTGTYGTNGFYLNFKDNTSTTTLGYDYSGNSNNWTANNISLTAGSTYDSMLDVPTPWIGYSATTDTSAVTRGNYAVVNPLKKSASATITDGNLTVTWNSLGGEQPASFAQSSGKWYWEQTQSSSSAAPGIILDTATPSASSISQGYHYYGNGQFYTGTSGVAYGATFGSGDIIGVALDLDTNQITFYKNGASQGAKTIVAGTYNPDFAAGTTITINANFGQRPFSYTPPTGFKALCTTNLPEPTIKLGASYMAASTYTGTGATLSIANSGNNTTATTFQPDFVWIKQRSGSAQSHYLVDSVRGNTLQLASQSTAAESTATNALTSFNSNGFSLGNNSDGFNVNASTQTYIGWQWKANGAAVSNTDGTLTSQVSANTTAGFSVVTYTGSGSNATVGHGLGVAPAMIIVKNRTVGGDWKVYNVNVGNTYQGFLNDPAAFQGSSPTLWNSTTPTSTVFSIGTNAGVNASGNSHVAYCFAEVAGYSKFGSYTGNGSTDGPFVYCGFRPRYVLIKRTDSTSDWTVWDTARNTYNTMNLALYPNLSNAEVNTSIVIDTLSNGFKVRNSNADTNASGGTYIYACFAENPFKYSNAR